MADEVMRAKRKLIALKRAQFALKQRFERIDFEMDVIQPAVKELELDAAQGELPTFTAEVD